ncbi:RipA family octameric membrane protein [Acinetobacter piscicola]|uniref:RipA family octameric membrane protein n=1 Tax=Acinetobacter piscicola TaxID=2006115 RepID=UPI000B7D85B0|nr:hypothetical protein [Acinetobacter piscicola]
MSFFRSLLYEKNNNLKLSDDLARLKSIYEIAIETRNCEIQQLVHRNNFFMIFQGVLVASIIYSNNTVALIHFFICLFGIVISFYQMQIAAGAKFWQEYWENQVNEAENNLESFFLTQGKSFHKLFNKNVKNVQYDIFSKYYENKKDKIFDASKYNNLNVFSLRFIKQYSPFTSKEERILLKPSVSKVPIATARMLLIIWIMLLFFSTGLGNSFFNQIKGYQLITGFPGKAITHVDIRNQSLPNREDGYDDTSIKCTTNIPFKRICE